MGTFYENGTNIKTNKMTVATRLKHGHPSIRIYFFIKFDVEFRFTRFTIILFFGENIYSY